MSRAWEMLRSAVHKLVRVGSPKERLAGAIEENLLLLRLKDLPPEVRKDYAKLVDDLCLGRVQENGATVKSMVESVDDAQVTEMIDSIINMYDAVTRYEPILAPNLKNTAIIPPPAISDPIAAANKVQTTNNRLHRL